MSYYKKLSSYNKRPESAHHQRPEPINNLDNQNMTRASFSTMMSTNTSSLTSLTDERSKQKLKMLSINNQYSGNTSPVCHKCQKNNQAITDFYQELVLQLEQKTLIRLKNVIPQYKNDNSKLDVCDTLRYTKLVTDELIKYNRQVEKELSSINKDQEIKNYEQQLIKLEAEIRQHIRVEQQLKLYIENSQDKLDEYEKMKEKIEKQQISDKKQKNEDIQKENQRSNINQIKTLKQYLKNQQITNYHDFQEKVRERIQEKQKSTVAQKIHNSSKLENSFKYVKDRVQSKETSNLNNFKTFGKNENNYRSRSTLSTHVRADKVNENTQRDPFRQSQDYVQTARTDDIKRNFYKLKDQLNSPRFEEKSRENRSVSIDGNSHYYKHCQQKAKELQNSQNNISQRDVSFNKSGANNTSGSFYNSVLR